MAYWGDMTGLPSCPWRLAFVLACLLAVYSDVADCMKLPAIHWNSSNPMFKTSNNDHVIQVNMYDDLDFICPSSYDMDDREYYVIYQVSKAQYETCSIYPSASRIMIVNCSNPNQRKRFTLLFEPFASIPQVPEFKTGDSYYYISTSTGRMEGISNEQEGACLYRNMKLTIQVCCETTTTTTTEPVMTARPHTRRPTPPKLRTTTDGNSIRLTEKVWDKTVSSDKPLDKGQGGENDINKDPYDTNQPKKEGLVNSARTLTPCRGLCSSMALILLSWLLPWLRR